MLGIRQVVRAINQVLDPLGGQLTDTQLNR
jgi:hypothetical protein